VGGGSTADYRRLILPDSWNLRFYLVPRSQRRSTLLSFTWPL